SVIYPLSLHDALPILAVGGRGLLGMRGETAAAGEHQPHRRLEYPRGRVLRYETSHASRKLQAALRHIGHFRQQQHAPRREAAYSGGGAVFRFARGSQREQKQVALPWRIRQRLLQAAVVVPFNRQLREGVTQQLT